MRRQETWALSQQDVELLLDNAHTADRVTVRKGNLLYGQGEISPHFYLIQRGEVRISCFEESGEETTIEVMGQYGLCGEAPAFDGLPRFTSAVALRDVEALRFDTRRLQSVFVDCPELAMALLRITSIKQRVLAIRLEYAFSAPPEKRILQLIRRVAALFGTSEQDGRSLGVHLTHDQIGRMTGISRVTVTRVFNRLRDRGVLAIKDGVLLVRADEDENARWPDSRAEASDMR
ncbi:cAMP receptor protein [compost metagenome]|uniref:Crp/Fnr family transcriptional regulator n=1 Tax=Variovorax boronicumulans TaxID=436515 RepID=UPI000BB2DF8A|nr:Crp/Fnr family transcriptional regulator [Variovorax boronicumulans]PBI87751.1 cAMP receptor protein [Variovorax boronicumulans]